jgi:Uma2 family endonuclease
MGVQTTLAADGFARRAFTVADVFAMLRAGVLNHSEAFELLEGEIVPMNAKRNWHEVVKSSLARQLISQTEPSFRVAIESSVYLTDRTICDPDLMVTAGEILPEQVKGPDILLLIEVADSSLEKDTTLKARLYARAGVSDYWVVDIPGRCWRLHRDPVGETYSAIETRGWDTTVHADRLPQVALTLPVLPA